MIYLKMLLIVIEIEDLVCWKNISVLLLLKIKNYLLLYFFNLVMYISINSFMKENLCFDQEF
jgi:hypothetical protein